MHHCEGSLPLITPLSFSPSFVVTVLKRNNLCVMFCLPFIVLQSFSSVVSEGVNSNQLLCYLIWGVMYSAFPNAWLAECVIFLHWSNIQHNMYIWNYLLLPISLTLHDLKSACMWYIVHYQRHIKTGELQPREQIGLWLSSEVQLSKYTTVWSSLNMWKPLSHVPYNCGVKFHKAVISVL